MGGGETAGGERGGETGGETGGGELRERRRRQAKVHSHLRRRLGDGGRRPLAPRRLGIELLCVEVVLELRSRLLLGVEVVLQLRHHLWMVKRSDIGDFGGCCVAPQGHGLPVASELLHEPLVTSEWGQPQQAHAQASRRSRTSQWWTLTTCAITIANSLALVSHIRRDAASDALASAAAARSASALDATDAARAAAARSTASSACVSPIWLGGGVWGGVVGARGAGGWFDMSRGGCVCVCVCVCVQGSRREDEGGAGRPWRAGGRGVQTTHLEPRGGGDGALLAVPRHAAARARRHLLDLPARGALARELRRHLLPLELGLELACGGAGNRPWARRTDATHQEGPWHRVCRGWRERPWASAGGLSSARSEDDARPWPEGGMAPHAPHVSVALSGDDVRLRGGRPRPWRAAPARGPRAASCRRRRAPPRAWMAKRGEIVSFRRPLAEGPRPLGGI